MNSEELHEIQSPLKDRYLEDPKAGQITLTARGRLSGDDVVCKVETGRTVIEAGLHVATGGSGLHACSANMLLDALVACAGVTMKAIAISQNIEMRSAEVRAEGDIDFRGTLGVSREVPVGFSRIRLKFVLDSDASAEQIDRLINLTERYCVVYQTLTNGAQVAVALEGPTSTLPGRR